MVESLRIDLIYFEGCPHTGTARENVAAALSASGRPVQWFEWDLFDEATPAGFRGYPSPTVLVEGTDVVVDESGGATSGTACRAGGAPTVEEIGERL